ncbi:SCN10A [Symbiodinium sp. CCMP2456]|nr:SCN10A [Symbiodinium sp. CCMP2456]
MDASEDIRYERGMSMISRLYPGGLFFAMPFRSIRDKPELEKAMGFLINMMVFCKMISVRCIFQLPYDLWETFRQHPRTQEVWDNLEMLKETITMASFGGHGQKPMVLVGHDRFVIRCMRYMAAQMLPRLGGFDKGKQSTALPGTFIYADFAPRNLGRLLNRICQNLMAQDLDEIFVVNARDYAAYSYAIDELSGSDAIDELSGSYAIDELSGFATIISTLSTKSMASVAEDEKAAGEANAKDFLLNTAKRSLDEAFGSSGSSSSEDSDTEPSQDGFEDAAATFGLCKKDMLRTPDTTTLVDLDARATALVLSKISPVIIANDIYEMGGELETLLRNKALSARKNRAKKEQEDAQFQMKAAGTMWKRRMGLLAQHLAGRPPSSIRLCAAKTLFDCSAVIRTLHKRKYPGGKEAWGQALDNMLQEARQAASDDLKLQMKQAEQPKAGRSAKPSKEKKAPEPEPEASENEKESVPSPVEPPPYCDSQSEQEDDEEDEDDDADVFAGKFRLPAKNADGPADLAKVSPKVKQALQSFDRDVVESLPQNLSPTDFGYWVLCLEKEALTKMEYFNLNIEGHLSQNLGTGKPFFAKMSLRARKSFDEWARKIPGVTSEAPGAPSEALRLQYYRKVGLTPNPKLSPKLETLKP